MRGEITLISKANRMLYMLKSQIRQDIANMKRIVEQAESHLTNDVDELTERVSDELEGLPEEQKEFMTGWYIDEFHCLERVFPNIQRRALFLTAMCMTEANILLACEVCHRAFNLPNVFKKKKKGNERVIVQALSFLESNLKIQKTSYDRDWKTINNYWILRNGLVHNDGVPRSSELKEVTDFCSTIPTLSLDQDNRLVFHKVSVNIVMHVVEDFFTRLMDEIDKNKLPNKVMVRK